MAIIIGISGKKQAGKDTLVTFLQNHFGQSRKVIRISTADPLKEMAMSLFGLSYQSVYGTDEQKNALTHIRWNSMPIEVRQETGSQFMSGRKFLQVFGTGIMRRIDSNVWSNALCNNIKKYSNEHNTIVCVPDIRFPNEVQAILDMGGHIIRLTRNVFDDQDPSETALDNYDWASIGAHIIDNSAMTLDKKNEYFVNNILNNILTQYHNKNKLYCAIIPLDFTQRKER